LFVISQIVLYTIASTLYSPIFFLIDQSNFPKTIFHIPR